METKIVQRDELSELTDNELAARAHDDFDAFAVLYRRYLCPVYRFVRSQTPSDTIAEDLTAHVFFKALSSAASYRGDGPYRAWIFTIAHNAVCTWRAQRSHATVAIERVREEPDPSPGPAGHVVASEDRSLVWHTVSALPPTQKEAVALHYLEDFSIREVAQITGRTRGAVRILLHRARQKLRAALEGQVQR